MCGIAGFYSSKALPKEFYIESLEGMGKVIEHRGPDRGDVWFDVSSQVGFAHRRLSILDLSDSGNQPMHSNCGRFLIIFNGEIYNHMALRDEINLDKINHKWNGSSDTETLLVAITIWGVKETLKKSRGMFAFSLWDKKSKNLILGRDRMGEKPLYYGWNNEFFLFGSELKSLKSHPGFDGEIDKESLSLFLKYSYVPCPKSIYKDINKLEQGTFITLSLESKTIEVEEFWSLKKNINGLQNTISRSSSKALVKDLDIILNTAVEEQMISDVPLGAFLSGGIDSSVIVSLMQSQSIKPVKTFTIGFSEKDYDESIYASETAKYLGTEHTDLQVTSKELLSVVPKLAQIYDEPFADSSQIPTYLLSKLASEDVKVSLSGDGGDEIFSGYNRYRFASNIWPKVSIIPIQLRKKIAKGLTSKTPEELKKISSFIPLFKDKYNNLSQKLSKAAKVLGSENIEDYYDNLVSQIDDPSYLIKGNKNKYKHDNKFLDDKNKLSLTESLMLQDSITYLPDDILVKLDRAAMSVSLETRVPFLDPRVMDFAWTLPMKYKIRGSETKWILREVLSKYLPKHYTDRPKSGFSIPLDDWLRGPLREWAEELLNEESISDKDLLNFGQINLIWEEHKNGEANRGALLWNILMFQLWIENS